MGDAQSNRLFDTLLPDLLPLTITLQFGLRLSQLFANLVEMILMQAGPLFEVDSFLSDPFGFVAKLARFAIMGLAILDELLASLDESLTLGCNLSGQMRLEAGTFGRHRLAYSGQELFRFVEIGRPLIADLLALFDTGFRLAQGLDAIGVFFL